MTLLADSLQSAGQAAQDTAPTWNKQGAHFFSLSLLLSAWVGLLQVSGNVAIFKVAIFKVA